MGAVMDYTFRAKNLSGERFGRLVAVGVSCLVGKKKNNQMWLCVCDCGTGKHVRRDSLLSGTIRSCGCLASDVTKKRMKTHGMHGTRLYRIWAGMLQRCNNHKSIPYQKYGATGISVCGEWREFMGFYEWAKTDYADNLTLDRIDPYGDYCPDNCRWADKFVQAINTRKKADHGVYWDKQTSKWRAEIKTKQRRISLGRHATKASALEARRLAEEKYHKPYLNTQLGIKV
jgi:hypothetical protein